MGGRLYDTIAREQPNKEAHRRRRRRQRFLPCMYIMHVQTMETGRGEKRRTCNVHCIHGHDYYRETIQKLCAWGH